MLRWDAPELRVPGDDPRTAAYRLLQSRWRESVLGLRPGRHVTGRLVGSLLPEDAPGDAQWLTGPVAAYVAQRLPAARAAGEATEETRLYRNLLSSQPLCFNVFGQLAAYPAASARVLSRLLGRDVRGVVTVWVEHAPPAAGRVLGDRSAFDAYLELDTADGLLLLGVETKYTEPFSARPYARPSYQLVTEDSTGWFAVGSAPVAGRAVSNQLWRTLMLAQLAERHASEPASAQVMVLTASRDRGAEAAVAALRPCLREPDARLRHVLLEELVRCADDEPDLRGWAGLFAARYLDRGLPQS
jgi:hypothetical protein